MFSKVSHLEGLVEEDEVLFSTPFDYFFPEAARSEACLLPTSEATWEILKHLADCMGDPGNPDELPAEDLDSTIPAIFTYFGQFIDHDLTARTDRDGSVTAIGNGASVLPLNPDEVVSNLRNGRRPTLDLDSVFGDGPALVAGAKTQSQILFDDALRMHVYENEDGNHFDLPRGKRVNAEGNISYPAIIADARNDENVMISQLQTAFIKFYNAIYDTLPGTNPEGYIQARQLASWAYQHVVIHDYLKNVCDPNIVEDTLLNGPRFIGASVGRAGSFMPLEFSVAAFRFGHSMIRSSYELNNLTGNLELLDLLETGNKPDNFEQVDPDGSHQLISEWVIDWNKFVGADAQKARKIDAKIARGLFSLGRTGPILKHLARSNLVRGYNLSIPIGQAMCDAFGIFPLQPNQILDCGDVEDDCKATSLNESWVDYRTPLWYYILREAAVQQDGNRLGELGSRIVSETIINLIKQDPNSFFNNCCHPAVEKDANGNVTGVRVAEGENGLIATLQDILVFAGVHVPNAAE
ncbi:peroxidase family protein [Candidatus Leptofilum sp.]|uniref:peroxidase family protein n=1 Tax=Candidatus Leptofilum sp. TaxID=3241576 RepID=UPI003B58F078